MSDKVRHPPPPTVLMGATVLGLAVGLFLMWLSGPEHEIRAIVAVAVPALAGAIVGAALTGQRRFARRKAALAAIWLVGWPLLSVSAVAVGWSFFVGRDPGVELLIVLVAAFALPMLLLSLLSRRIGAGLSGDVDQQLEKSEADRAAFQEIASLRERQGGRLSESAGDDAEGRLSGAPAAGAVSETAKKS